MDNLDFSEEEIQEQLLLLGYKNIPKHRLHEFKRDLDELIRHGDWKSFASPAQINSTKSPTATSQPSPPAYTKEKVSHCYFEDSEGFFLHGRQADHDRQVLTTCQNRDYGRQQGRCDTYAQHSVASKLRLPPGAPNRLQVEPDPDETLYPPLADSYTSTPDSQGRRFIKRKVLRKHKGQSLVCDESIYSEDSERSSEEEKVEIERVISEDDAKPVTCDTEDTLQETSVDRKPELKEGNVSGESMEGGSVDDDVEDGDDEESCSSSCDSPAPSLMTSGYGTYRPEEQEGGDYRDDHTITEFDQDSRGDLSEVRDDEEDDRSLCSFSGFDRFEPTEPDYDETHPLSVLADTEPEAYCGDNGLREEVDITDMKPDEDKDQESEKEFDLRAVSENEVTDGTSEEQHDDAVAEDKFILDEKHLEGDSVDVEQGKLNERLEEEVQDIKEENKVESEDPDESSSNKDIKFIDSKVDFSQMTYEEMCKEWEGNLRQKKDAASCLEERLAELNLSTSPQRDFETENEDVTSQSDTQSSETGGISMSAFESYIRGMTQAQSDVRPKPKSFIRPVMSQKAIKKTDPVAKYFQYKQLWEMFKLPGEKDRRHLRLEIKERLAYQPPPPKPRRVYVPNTYIVPTEKKRSALRWEVRNDLANGLVPYKFNYRF